MDGTLLEKKYDIVNRIKALEEGQGEQVVYLPSNGISIQEVEEGEREVSVKLAQSGGLTFNENGELYSEIPSMVDQNMYNFNNATPTQIGRVTIGQNTYPLYRVFADPAYAVFTPEAQETTVNFLGSNVIPYPLDERAINIKFFANGIDVTNTFEFGRVGLNGSSYLQCFSCHMANRVQITKIMVEYYVIPTTSEEAKSTTSKKKTSK